jgi:polysaccharide export outer membrane protein
MSTGPIVAAIARLKRLRLRSERVSWYHHARPLAGPERSLDVTRLLTTLTLVLALTVLQLGLPAPAWALYQLDYGDSIIVTVKDAPQYATTAQIRPDGAITVPYVGDVEVAGLTPFQVGERIEKLLSRYLRGPQVTVSVSSFRNWEVSLFGEVGRPGNVTVPAARITPTVMDALAQAGGFTDRANRSEVVLIRGSGPDAKRYIVNVERMLKTGDFSENLQIQDRDKIMVYEVWYPDIRETLSVITTTASVVAALTLIFNAYNRAAGQ